MKDRARARPSPAIWLSTKPPPPSSLQPNFNQTPSLPRQSFASLNFPHHHHHYHQPNLNQTPSSSLASPTTFFGLNFIIIIINQSSTKPQANTLLLHRFADNLFPHHHQHHCRHCHHHHHQANPSSPSSSLASQIFFPPGPKCR